MPLPITPYATTTITPVTFVVTSSLENFNNIYEGATREPQFMHLFHILEISSSAIKHVQPRDAKDLTLLGLFLISEGQKLT